MKPISLAAAMKPRPALLLTYAHQESMQDAKIKRRFMPIREPMTRDRRLQDVEGLADRLVGRQPILQSVPRKCLLQVLFVLHSVSAGASLGDAIREAEEQLRSKDEFIKKVNASDQKKRRVSFRDGPHDVRLIESDEASDAPALEVVSPDATADEDVEDEEDDFHEESEADEEKEDTHASNENDDVVQVLQDSDDDGEDDEDEDRMRGEGGKRETDTAAAAEVQEVDSEEEGAVESPDDTEVQTAVLFWDQEDGDEVAFVF